MLSDFYIYRKAPRLPRGRTGTMYSEAALSLILACAILLVFRRRQHFPLPPSPPSDPIIGHLRRLPATDFPGQLCKWAKEYGSH